MKIPPHPVDQKDGDNRLRALLRAIRNSNVCVLYQSLDMRYQWSENLPPYWLESWKVGGKDCDFIFTSSLSRLEQAKQAALETGLSQNVELAIHDNNMLRWVEFHIDCDRDEDDNIIGLVTTALEISESKRREQMLKILLREVSHRSKNLLAIVQSIASQTARFSESIDDFMLKLRGRIQSLSYSQDLVTDSNWHGALFHDLLNSQLEKYIDVGDERLIIRGDNPYLFPGAALHTGLALHELIVNATSFGGLTIPHGRIEITAKVTSNKKGEEYFVFRWEEINSALSVPIEHGPRFGSAVLQRIVPAAVGGHAEYRISPTGAVYQLTIPTEQFDI